MNAIAEAIEPHGFRCVLPDLPAHGASSGETVTIPEAADALVRIGTMHGPFDLCVGHSVGAAILLAALGKGLATKAVALVAPPANYVRQMSMQARSAGAPEALIAAALDVLRERCPELDELDICKMAKHLTQPGVVIVAGRDEILDPENGRELAALWSAGRLVEDPDASHRSILKSTATIGAVVGLAERA
jgi:pimeloyl-ACP methyl ester carboxylesterase